MNWHAGHVGSREETVRAGGIYRRETEYYHVPDTDTGARNCHDDPLDVAAVVETFHSTW